MADKVELLFEVKSGGAVKQTDALSKSVANLDKRADSAAKAVRRTSASAKDFEDKAGDADSVAQGLASAIGLVDKNAEMAVRTVGDLAGGVEATIRGFTRFASPTVIGAVIVAVGALVAVYAKLNKELKEAEARQKAAADRASQASDVAARRAEIELQTQLLTGEISQADFDAIKNREAARAGKGGEMLAAAKGAADAANAELARLQAEQEAIQASAGTIGSLIKRDEINKAVEEQTKRVERLAEEYFQAEQMVRGLEGALNDLSSARDKKKGASRAGGGSAATIPGVPAPTGARIGGVGNSFLTGPDGSSVLIGTSGRKPQPVVITGPNGERLGAQAGGANSAAAVMFADEVAAALRSERNANRLQAAAGIGQAALGGLASGSLSGGVMSAASAIPGAGQVVAAVSALEAIGRAGKIEIDFEQMADAVVKGVEVLIDSLPEIIESLLNGLLTALPRIMEQLMFGFVESIPKIIGSLVEALIKHIASLPGRIAKSLTGLPVRLLKGLGQSIKGLGRDAGAATKALFSGENVAQAVAEDREQRRAASFDVGSSFVPRTGMYRLHQGEMVMPSSGNNGQAGNRAAGAPMNRLAPRQRNTGGGGVTVVGGNVYNVQSLIRDVERRIGPIGTSSSTVLGGS